MTQAVKLFDITDEDRPHKGGDEFRSVQVFKCWVCGALTNKVFLGGGPSWGMRQVCPNAAACWHHELEVKLVWLAKPHPASSRQELEKELEQFRGNHKKDVKDDLRGRPDFSQKHPVTTTSTFDKNEKGDYCEHSNLQL